MFGMYRPTDTIAVIALMYDITVMITNATIEHAYIIYTLTNLFLTLKISLFKLGKLSLYDRYFRLDTQDGSLLQVHEMSCYVLASWGTPLRLRRCLSYRFDTTFVSFKIHAVILKTSSSITALHGSYDMYF
jgi:hypothetical protein